MIRWGNDKLMKFVGNDSCSNGISRPQFGLRWKMFELDACDGNGRVCLVFPPKPEPPPVDSDQIGSLSLSWSFFSFWPSFLSIILSFFPPSFLSLSWSFSFFLSFLLFFILFFLSSFVSFSLSLSLCLFFSLSSFIFLYFLPSFLSFFLPFSLSVFLFSFSLSPSPSSTFLSHFLYCIVSLFLLNPALS